MNSGKKAQIKAQVRVQLFDEAPIKVLTEYSNYSNIFSAENAAEFIAELPKNFGINRHIIELKKGK